MYRQWLCSIYIYHAALYIVCIFILIVGYRIIFSSIIPLFNEVVHETVVAAIRALVKNDFLDAAGGLMRFKMHQRKIHKSKSPFLFPILRLPFQIPFLDKQT